MKKRELDGLREEVRERLAMVAQWILDNPNADILNDFDESVYDKLYNDGQRARFAREYINLALGKAYQEENLPLYNDVEEDAALLEEDTTVQGDNNGLRPVTYHVWQIRL